MTWPSVLEALKTITVIGYLICIALSTLKRNSHSHLWYCLNLIKVLFGRDNPKHAKFVVIFHFVQQPFWTHETVLQCFADMDWPSFITYGLYRMFWYHDSYSSLRYLEFYGDGSRWSSGTFTIDILIFPHKFWLSHGIRTPWILYFFFFLL